MTVTLLDTWRSPEARGFFHNVWPMYVHEISGYDTDFSAAQVMEIQKRLESELEKFDGIRGVGIGFDKKRHRPKFKVTVDRAVKADKLPHEIDELEVQYDIVDDIKAV